MNDTRTRTGRIQWFGFDVDECSLSPEGCPPRRSSWPLCSAPSAVAAPSDRACHWPARMRGPASGRVPGERRARVNIRRTPAAVEQGWATLSTGFAYAEAVVQAELPREVGVRRRSRQCAAVAVAVAVAVTPCRTQSAPVPDERRGEDGAGRQDAAGFVRLVVRHARLNAPSRRSRHVLLTAPDARHVHGLCRRERPVQPATRDARAGTEARIAPVGVDGAVARDYCPARIPRRGLRALAERVTREGSRRVAVVPRRPG